MSKIPGKCERCGKRINIDTAGWRRKYCETCSHGRYLEREAEMVSRYHPLRKKAMGIIVNAKRDGKLPRLWNNPRIKCLDCGRPAQCWDHRDYAKPLDVEPVCFSCNCKRGSAKNAWNET